MPARQTGEGDGPRATAVEPARSSIVLAVLSVQTAQPRPHRTLFAPPPLPHAMSRLDSLASLLIRIQAKIETRSRRPWFDLQVRHCDARRA